MKIKPKVENIKNIGETIVDTSNKVEVPVNNMTEYERKLAISETEITIAHIKHNIAYLECSLQHAIIYLNTL